VHVVVPTGVGVINQLRLQKKNGTELLITAGDCSMADLADPQ
jgi:hypothetical protein